MTNDKDHRVAEVLQLVTFVDTDDAIIDTRRISMSASHRALLDTGTWVVLINNRGWCDWARKLCGPKPPPTRSLPQPARSWVPSRP